MPKEARTASVDRVTKETKVSVSWNLDGSGEYSIGTGLPFFDHMLAQIAKHSGTDLTLTVSGDIEVDAHHSVEDTGIVMGQALSQALGDKAGIRRFASLSLPLDESLVSVALDISGRPYLDFNSPLLDGNPLGNPGFDPQLTEEFFRALVTSAGMTLHLDVIRGKNSHHILEASFKCFARCLRHAIEIDGISMPSTKGVI